MHKLFDKLIQHGGKEVAGPHHIPQETRNKFSDEDVYRYRKQRGVNLGSWFVLERWITSIPFQLAKSPAKSDLDVARGTDAREILERHWDTWITDQDWKWISDRGLNSVRIPIGYYHVCGIDPTVLHGTDFEPYYEIFCGAWERIILAIQKAASHNIGVLIDLHAAPGKQNNDAHAGTSGPSNFFRDEHHQKSTIRALCSLVKNLNHFTNSFSPPLSNLIGIELLNEPHPPSDGELKSWYTKAISKVRAIDPIIPIHLGECWRPDSYADFIAQHPSSAPIVLDHHLYRCFTSSDTTTSAEAHSRSLTDANAATSKMFASIAEKVGRAGGGIVIGEWSGALNPGSLRGKPDEQRDFVHAELALFERTCSGWFFWTYKKEKSGDTGWSLRDAVNGGVFPSFVGIKPNPSSMKDDENQSKIRDLLCDKALAAHTQYWSRYSGRCDHARFSEGYHLGWDDVFQLMLSTPANSTSINEIGFKGAWARRRTQKHDKHYWEFEAGFLQAIGAAIELYMLH
ncbi:glycoside hydrolase [Pholiota conissans]|uniref:Glycoside hydrolase n=1 Tax=Pholiota conissans TaxID=109636 RepID=A0A9P5YMP7_9AGAR|nr:glycoside hydrolase [Pholiota conissans]